MRLVYEGVGEDPKQKITYRNCEESTTPLHTPAFCWACSAVYTYGHYLALTEQID